MMNNNKILTVSYGTFSCTLEGFEDSFGTMKAIAEYFRDLAADDRYFGAEPPQPDAEMLARIAEKEVARRVEARQQDGQIVLSALAPAAPAVASQPPVAQTVGAPAVAEDVVEPAAPAPATPQPEVALDQGDSVKDALTLSDVQTDAATLDSIRAVATASADDVAPEQAAPEQDAEEDLTADAESAAEADAMDDAMDIVPGQPDAAVEAFFEAEDTAEEVETPKAEAVAPAIASAPDSVTAKLERIRAVVSRQAAAKEDTYLEDQHADTAAAAARAAAQAADDDDANDNVFAADAPADDVVADARAEIEEALEADDAAEVATDDAEEDALSALLSRVRATEDTSPILTAAAATIDEDVAETIETADVSETHDADEPDAADDAGSALADTAEEAPEPPADTPVKAESAPVAPRASTQARVIKVKRADLQAAIEKGDLEEVYEDEEKIQVKSAPQADTAAGDESRDSDASEAEPVSDLDALAPAKRDKTSLSPDEEAALAKELSDLAADIEAEGDEETSDAEGSDAEADATTPPAQRLGRSKLPSLDDESGDVNRLLSETDQQMDEPETATRRDAFAHLRAAVAARKADASISEKPAGRETAGVYREDLAEVVRPRRPVSGEARTERPEPARPAPLKLVAEQRIDVDHTETVTPVRPRRIAGVSETEAMAQDSSFSDYAAEMGASSLPELLEAAASYLSFVEGREQFSRPQLMTKVRQAGGETTFSREEGLRHFGQLLRKGKIEKIKGGRFTASDDIGFRPDERAAG